MSSVRFFYLIQFVWLLYEPSVGYSQTRKHAQPEQKAISFLMRETPQWLPNNKCFSCHNNGDAARALYLAKRNNYSVPDAALADTTKWLAHPEKWKHNGGDGEFSDKRLAAIQFSAALSDAIRSDCLEDKTPLMKAALHLASLQQPDGSWSIDNAGAIGSPVTYGRRLATLMARNVLLHADPHRFSAEIEKANGFFLSSKPQTVLDAAATLWALAASTRKHAAAQKEHCLTIIRRGQDVGGGWGPYANSRPEAFDTAVVLLALSAQKDKQLSTLIERGRRYLIQSQLEDGSWTETTRPADAESYAQRISTSGWAAIALIETKSSDEP